MEKATGLFGTIKKGFTNLTKREQVLIYGLVIVAVLAILIFLIILPAMTHLSDLSDDVSQYQSEEMEMRLTISQADVNEQQYEKATKNFNKLKKQFYMPMDPESLDETITALIVQSGLSPRSLKMTTLQQGKIPAYTIQPLVSAGIPVTTSSGAATNSAVAEGGNTDGTDNNEGTDAYVYTASASADGDKNQLSKLIDLVNATSGIELYSYNYSLTKDENASEKVTIGGSVELTFYVYVYVDNTSGITYQELGAEDSQ